MFYVCTQFDIKWKQSHIPIVYDENYNIKMTTLQLPLPPQSMLLDKPAKVYSKIKGQ